ncbi:zinc-dependent alcohol dehydrogenase [Nocardioides bruguierae]|uniref:zinc-dependent alcohol dehydrogenase n=1 Tax=Nocardioides bruguierae TaxID=2945102 RepID=UPI00201FF14C|nr:alcohol dehydrogenase catalytic domain-containing protein [Nocardioides bruguierae]MCL8025482.1 alcohol dehydrogenase catalytic domain-containing protein [Nocardioides bruguierae]
MSTPVMAASYLGAGTIEVSPVSVPDPAPGQVQVEVAFVGICGTDLHLLHGAMDSRVTVPAVIGHEMSGRVAAVGAGVTDHRVGDPVTVMPLVWDGTCPACAAGHQHVCQHLDFVGIDSPGALQGRWNVPASIVVGLPAGTDLRHAALVEPVAVAVHDVRRGEVAPGDRVVVLGGGPIGLLVAVVARHAGGEVLLLEPDAGRRAVVEGLGLRTADPVGQDADLLVQEWTGGAGADVVFEVSGAAPAVLQATALAKVRGTLVVVAIHPQPVPVDLKQVFWRELRLLGARVYERADFEEAGRLLADGVVPTDVMITDVLPLERVADAFTTLEAGGAMKLLVDVGGARVPADAASGSTGATA